MRALVLGLFVVAQAISAAFRSLDSPEGPRLRFNVR